MVVNFSSKAKLFFNHGNISFIIIDCFSLQHQYFFFIHSYLTQQEQHSNAKWCLIWVSSANNDSHKDSIPGAFLPGHSWILVEICIPFKILPESLINLAGPSAKFDSSGILGIAQIPPDSGRNQWRTINTSTWEEWSTIPDSRGKFPLEGYKDTPCIYNKY